MDGTRNTTRELLAVVLRFALVGAIFAAIWGVYERVPHDGAPLLGERQAPAATSLRIRLRLAAINFPVAERRTPVQIYPINMMAARNEYDSERRPGVRFEDFALRLMGDRQPLTAELDERGEALVAVPPGRWWVYVTVSGARELSWRRPVNVSGREMTLELTPENAYTRAQRF